MFTTDVQKLTDDEKTGRRSNPNKKIRNSQIWQN